MITYKNINGKPIIRSCFNCMFYHAIKTEANSGYCKFKPLLFAFTLQSSVFPIVKTFYLCENHKFSNEEHLKATAEAVDLRDILKSKENIQP